METCQSLAAALVLLLLSAGASAASGLLGEWSDGDALPGIVPEQVTFPSHSPFMLRDVGGGPEVDPPTEAVGTLYLPAVTDPPAPAVILLHGASGVRGAREQIYGRQLAAMGIAALVIDAFARRRDMGRGFIQRILNITETMLIADAYAGLRYLATRPEIDGRRVVLMGFSYGGMASVIAAYAQVAELFAPGGERFAGHVSFYGPCIARFEEPRTTGAPVLMLFGDQDQIMNADRCAATVADLERGGSVARMIVYPGARHQWDGDRIVPWRAPRHLADCAVTVDADGDVVDDRTHLPMIGPTTRRIILGLCSDDDGYLVARDDAVRARSNDDLGAFLQALLLPSRG
ncbi:MAG TPA: dienelactone hydrolase family protein [Geminicoccaceae bacterium]|nr:dienelactone hydrolase family protein [Geminicoccaceae bacterium]